MEDKQRCFRDWRLRDEHIAWLDVGVFRYPRGLEEVNGPIVVVHQASATETLRHKLKRFVAEDVESQGAIGHLRDF